MRGAPMCYARAMRASLLVLIGAFMWNGCGDIKPAAPKACTKAYEQCTMPSGVLGVCDTVDCAAGQSGPCLVCRSQH
jgi:hypothetical protein